MPEKCTCGTTLVDDARFCHRCGRPTSQAPENVAAYDEPVIPVVMAGTGDVSPGLTPLQAKFASLPIGFGNPVALRVAFIMSLSIMLLDVLVNPGSTKPCPFQNWSGTRFQSKFQRISKT